MIALHAVEPYLLVLTLKWDIQVGFIVVTVIIKLGEVLPSVGINPESIAVISQSQREEVITSLRFNTRLSKSGLR